MGAIRMYRTFSKAMANAGDEYMAIPLAPPAGSLAWPVTVTLLPGGFNALGRVQGFTLSTERENVEISALGDKYKHFLSSAISGSGSVDCLFDFKDVSQQELPLAIAQLIQKIEVGSKFEGKFYILETFGSQPPGYSVSEGVFYQAEEIGRAHV